MYKRQGISAIEGEFSRGSVVKICGENGEIARGIVNYNSAEIEKIKGCQSKDIASILGLSLIHILFANELAIFCHAFGKASDFLRCQHSLYYGYEQYGTRKHGFCRKN